MWYTITLKGFSLFDIHTSLTMLATLSELNFAQSQDQNHQILNDQMI